jgi:hypothetical protein
MTRKNSIDSLLAGAGKLAECKERRAAWVRETAARLRAAQRAMDDNCMAAIDRMSDEAFERLFALEQAKVDLYLAPLRAAADRDLWPRHLYVGGV